MWWNKQIQDRSEGLTTRSVGSRVPEKCNYICRFVFLCLSFAPRLSLSLRRGYDDAAQASQRVYSASACLPARMCETKTDLLFRATELAQLTLRAFPNKKEKRVPTRAREPKQGGASWAGSPCRQYRPTEPEGRYEYEHKKRSERRNESKQVLS